LPPPILMRCQMETAEEILEEALLLADVEPDVGAAVSVLLRRADRRVPLIMVKRSLQSRVDQDPSDQVVARALEIVKGVLDTGSWPE
jgi:hypothetical protein